MIYTITLVSFVPLALQAVQADMLRQVSLSGGIIEFLGEEAINYHIRHQNIEELLEEIDILIKNLPIDVAIQEQHQRQKKLLVSDMDSTMISCECLDELADYAGKKPEIAAITEKAMQGQIKFEDALRTRVLAIAGLDLKVLQQCYDERVRANPGAATLIRTMAHHGAKTILVSGGFTYFTSRVAKTLGFSDHRGNILLDDGQSLTGQVKAPILGASAKLHTLEDEAKRLQIDLKETMAIGDGANDLPMILASGLGIAYRAKPIVAEQAKARIYHTDLTAALYFQGYSKTSFVPGEGKV